MKRDEIIIFSVTLVLTGVLILLQKFSIVSISIKEIIIMDLFSFGILSVYIGFNRGSRALISFASSSFLIGIFLFITNNYEMFSTDSIYIFALLFISATNFLMLFVENTKSISFLFASILIYIFAGFSITLFEDTSINYIASGLIKMLIGYVPLFLLLIGINILADSRK